MKLNILVHLTSFNYFYSHGVHVSPAITITQTCKSPRFYVAHDAPDLLARCGPIVGTNVLGHVERVGDVLRFDLTT